MKMRIKWPLVLVILMLFSLIGCSNQPNEKEQTLDDQDKPVVFASIYPMYDFAKNIGKDRIDLRLVVPTGAEPHDWEPTAKLIAQMEEADVFIYNGLQMEPWVDNVLTSIENDKLRVVKASEGIDLRLIEEEEENHEDEEDHGQYDPHVWLDPLKAIEEANNIKNVLVLVDDENKDYYEANFEEFADKLRALDRKYKDVLSEVKRRDIVVAHAAFGYLTDRYGLNQIAVTGLTPQEEPSAGELIEIIEILREKNIHYVFFETLTSPKLAEVLAREVGAKVAVLNPIGGLTREEMNEGKDYLSTMEENLKTLESVLGDE